MNADIASLGQETMYQHGDTKTIRDEGSRSSSTTTEHLEEKTVADTGSILLVLSALEHDESVAEPSGEDISKHGEEKRERRGECSKADVDERIHQKESGLPKFQIDGLEQSAHQDLDRKNRIGKVASKVRVKNQRTNRYDEPSTQESPTRQSTSGESSYQLQTSSLYCSSSPSARRKLICITTDNSSASQLAEHVLQTTLITSSNKTVQCSRKLRTDIKLEKNQCILRRRSLNIDKEELIGLREGLRESKSLDDCPDGNDIGDHLRGKKSDSCGHLCIAKAVETTLEGDQKAEDQLLQFAQNHSGKGLCPAVVADSEHKSNQEKKTVDRVPSSISWEQLVGAKSDHRRSESVSSLHSCSVPSADGGHDWRTSDAAPVDALTKTERFMAATKPKSIGNEPSTAGQHFPSQDCKSTCRHDEEFQPSIKNPVNSAPVLPRRSSSVSLMDDNSETASFPLTPPRRSATAPLRLMTTTQRWDAIPLSYSSDDQRRGIDLSPAFQAIARCQFDRNDPSPPLTASFGGRR